MISPSVNILVKCPLAVPEIIRGVKMAAQKEKKIRSTVEINVVGDTEIQELNRRYRGLNKPTDVLSFSWQEDDAVPSASLGQVYIDYPQIVRQARRFKVPVEEEFYRMLTHGLLHLVGHDHHEEAEAKKMFALQESVVEAIFKSKND